MAKLLFTPPPFAPGEKVSKALELGLLALKSESIAFDAGASVPVFEVPENTLARPLRSPLETVLTLMVSWMPQQLVSLPLA
jgi:hypothetical protein